MSAETETETDQSAAEREAQVDYLEQEISIINPKTPFMRDNLKVIWGTFIIWIVVVFGPVTVAAIAPEAADAARIAGTPALFMVTAIGTPLGALLLAVAYAYQRDRLDEKYGISHEQFEGTDDESAAAADGGEPDEPSADEGSEGVQSSPDETADGGERDSHQVDDRSDGGESQ